MQYVYFYWVYSILLPELTIWGHCKFRYSRITNLSPCLNSSFVKRMMNASNGHQHTSTPSTTYHAYLSNEDSTTWTRTYLPQFHFSTMVCWLSDVGTASTSNFAISMFTPSWASHHEISGCSVSSGGVMSCWLSSCVSESGAVLDGGIFLDCSCCTWDPLGASGLTIFF